IIWKTESSKYPRLKWETGGIPPVTPTTTAECGNAKNTPTSVAPTTNLCELGTATTVTGSGTTVSPWSWTCVGTTTATCTAYAIGQTPCLNLEGQCKATCPAPGINLGARDCATGTCCKTTTDTTYCGEANDNEFTSLSGLSAGLCIEGIIVTNFDDNADNTGWIWKCGSSSCSATKIIETCTNGATKCEGTISYVCQSNTWVSRGCIVGQCGATSCGGTVTYCGDNIIQKPNSGGIEEICDDGTAHNGVACNPATGGECTYCTADCLSTITIEEDENGNQCSFKGTQDGKCSTGADSIIINYESVSGNDPECDYNIPSPQTVSCPARLPFFTLFNLVITLVCVGLIYIVIMMLRRRKVGKGKKRR
ncbi:MAG: hypothetical protein Q7R52_00085, partial [archaeon]|nr:hypothetical protein [archaeon]